MSKSRAEVLALVPARGGSKGIPKKNVISLRGQPLIYYTAEAIRKSRVITRSIVSTDCQKIAGIASRLGLPVPFLRPEHLAQDDTQMIGVVEHALCWLERNESYIPDYIVLLQPTSPLRTTDDIDQAMLRLLHSDADSIVSVVKVPHNCTPESIMYRDDDETETFALKSFVPRNSAPSLRQQKKTYYARNGAAIYGFSRECLVNKKSIYGDRVLGFEMPQERSVDVDSPWELELCEYLLGKST